MDKHQPFFVDGKPTLAFKRRSSFYKLTIQPNGTVTYQPHRELMENALRKMNEDGERRNAEVRAHLATLAAAHE